MKKIIIMSDNHGQTNHIDMIYEKYHLEADLFIHCGDFESYDDVVDCFVAVPGNNDWGSNLEKIKYITIEGMNVCICHGQQFGYFNRECYMIEFAKEHNIDILITGHTHIPMFKCIDGIYLVNPGSTYLPRGNALPSYAIMQIDHGKVSVKFIPFTM